MRTDSSLQTLGKGKTKAGPIADLDSFRRVSKRSGSGLAESDFSSSYDGHPPLWIDRVPSFKRLATLLLQRPHLPTVVGSGWIIGSGTITTISVHRNTVEFATISVFIKFWVGLLWLQYSSTEKASSSPVYSAGLRCATWIIPEVVAALTWRGGCTIPSLAGSNVLLVNLGIIDTGAG